MSSGVRAERRLDGQGASHAQLLVAKRHHTIRERRGLTRDHQCSQVVERGVGTASVMNDPLEAVVGADVVYADVVR